MGVVLVLIIVPSAGMGVRFKQSKHERLCILYVILYPHISCFHPRETLKEVLTLLRNSGNPQVEYIIRIMRKWAKDNRVLLS